MTGGTTFGGRSPGEYDFTGREVARFGLEVPKIRQLEVG